MKDQTAQFLKGLREGTWDAQLGMPRADHLADQTLYGVGYQLGLEQWHREYALTTFQQNPMNQP